MIGTFFVCFVFFVDIYERRMLIHRYQFYERNKEIGKFEFIFLLDFYG